MKRRPYIHKLKYFNFTRRIHAKSAARFPFPLNANLEITHRCNLKCVHCYIPAHYVSEKKELNYKEICYFVDSIVNEGCLWLLITGGEPLLRNVFFDVYTYAIKKGLFIILFTNGTLLTPQVADFLKDMPSLQVEISLYGITKDTYESVTRVPGSFEACMRGIHLLVERKIPLVLKGILLTLNKQDLSHMKRLAKTLKVHFKCSGLINPQFDGSKEPYRFMLPVEEAIKLQLSVEKRRWKEYLGRTKPRPVFTDYIFKCGSGKSLVHLDPYGKIMPCLLFRNHNYNLFEAPFNESWQRMSTWILSQRYTKEVKCSSCKLNFDICPQCPGWAYLESGDIETPTEYLCRAAHLIAKGVGYKFKEGG